MDVQGNEFSRIGPFGLRLCECCHRTKFDRMSSFVPVTTCLCGPTKVLIFACSGGSNVGPAANGAAVELTPGGKGKRFCLAGVVGRVEGLPEATKAAERIVAIDGGPVHCAREVPERAGFGPDVHTTVTEHGVSKGGGLMVPDGDVQEVRDHIASRIQG